MKKKFSHSRYDAVVVGARCAGAATALLLVRGGARVLIVDREPAMADTLSTHALMRPAVSQLSRWGVLDAIVAAGTPRISRARFWYGPECVDVPVKPDGEIAGLYAPRRWLLDRVLRDAAVEAGAELHTGVSLEGLTNDGTGRVTGARLLSMDGSVRHVSADIVIGADGRRSKTAELAGARTPISSSDRCAVAYSYWDGIDNEGYRFYFGDRVWAGLIPTNDGAHCVFAACSPDAFRDRFDKGLAPGIADVLAIWAPDLGQHLSDHAPAEPVRRFLGAPGHIRDCAGPGWALVGDAGYFKDPATAHGITDAFLDAERLARAFLGNPGDVRAYQYERDRFAPDFFAATQQLASLDWDYETLKAIHARLNVCMKAEHSALEGGAAGNSIAA